MPSTRPQAPTKSPKTRQIEYAAKIKRIRARLAEMAAYKQVLAIDGIKPDGDDKQLESELIVRLLYLEKQLAAMSPEALAEKARLREEAADKLETHLTSRLPGRAGRAAPAAERGPNKPRLADLRTARASSGRPLRAADGSERKERYGASHGSGERSPRVPQERRGRFDDPGAFSRPARGDSAQRKPRFDAAAANGPRSTERKPRFDEVSGARGGSRPPRHRDSRPSRSGESAERKPRFDPAGGANKPRAAERKPRDNASRPPRDNASRAPRDNASRAPRDNASRAPRDNASRAPRGSEPRTDRAVAGADPKRPQRPSDLRKTKPNTNASRPSPAGGKAETKSKSGRADGKRRSPYAASRAKPSSAGPRKRT